MTTDLLDALMSEVLAKLSVISEQKAASYETSPVQGGERDYSPKPMLDKPLSDYYGNRYNKAKTDASRRLVLLEAVTALREARRQSVREGKEPEYGSPLFKSWLAAQKESPTELARKYNVTRQYILQLRKAYA